MAYVETLGARRCAAVVLGQGDAAIRLIDNVPLASDLQHTPIAGVA